MPRTIPALINRMMLAWARQEAGYSPDEAAERAKVPQSKLLAWERDEKPLTLRQAENLARIYHQPYSIFCFETPPTITPLAAECRRLPGVKPGEETPELRFALRQMLYRRKVALRLMEELGGNPETFAFEARASEPAEDLAIRCRERLGITVDQQMKWSNEYIAWREWRSAVESLGALVFQFGKVELEEARGVGIFDFPTPVIGVNSKEIPASKPFTLLHELVHLGLANAREEQAALNDKRSEGEWLKLEQFAEQVAGAMLMPASALAADPDIRLNPRWTVPLICRLARRYKVTPLAMATRLMRLGRCDPSAYRQWKKDWEEFLKEHPPRNRGGIATPAEKALGRYGQPFTGLVLEALTQERITALDAAQFLDLKYPHVETLRLEFAFARPSGERGGT